MVAAPNHIKNAPFSYTKQI